MTKRDSEPAFGAALRHVSLAVVVYKPPDDARNWKPCDYMVWVEASDHVVDEHAFPKPVWFECKDVDAIDVFNWRREMRQSQLQGIREAKRIGIPYWLAIYWRKHRHWTISDAVALYDHTRLRPDHLIAARTFRRTTLMSSLGIDSTPGQLESTLKGVLLGELEQ